MILAIMGSVTAAMNTEHFSPYRADGKLVSPGGRDWGWRSARLIEGSMASCAWLLVLSNLLGRLSLRN